MSTIQNANLSYIEDGNGDAQLSVWFRLVDPTNFVETWEVVLPTPSTYIPTNQHQLSVQFRSPSANISFSAVAPKEAVVNTASLLEAYLNLPKDVRPPITDCFIPLFAAVPSIRRLFSIES